MDPAPRRPEPHEYLPADYFRRAERSEIFSHQAPLEVDLGCGDGSFLLGMAREFPERNFLGVERLLGRVRKVCKRASNAGLENVRLLRLESRYTIEWLLPEASVSRLHLLCPDPWPKVRHHRRRLFQPPFLDAVRKVLVPGGEFLFMTDHPEYFEWAEEIMTHYTGLQKLPWQDGDFFYPKTDFQVQWESEGKSMHRMRLAQPL
ncbi:tRNA (guanine-N7-)-methyltransferase [Haloferula luteola]|uniref:tRNA (guanine-N(7)-)-methyltransferase n=1 Tax=Haloferula luteola TaxID=595692 RepID=A0A840VJ55_9BACT|nr:tRNA (guanosine(46)-N7)-methyltransferase TrmB [Haloferula luteola]MBB5352731.1 tRNA (guanine-N7-)-methyltransferase [Haloferula luteola]